MQGKFEQVPVNSHEMNRTRIYETAVCFTEKKTCNLVRDLALGRVLGGAIEVIDCFQESARATRTILCRGRRGEPRSVEVSRGHSRSFEVIATASGIVIDRWALQDDIGVGAVCTPEANNAVPGLGRTGGVGAFFHTPFKMALVVITVTL
jgi:hypothetical protein